MKEINYFYCSTVRGLPFISEDWKNLVQPSGGDLIKYVIYIRVLFKGK